MSIDDVKSSCARCVAYAWVSEYAIACVELGLRWLDDRCRESRARQAQRRRQDPAGKWWGQ